MANLGNVGKTFKSGVPFYARKWYMLGKQPTSVDMTATSEVPYSFVSLFRNSVLQDRSRSGSSGVWHFYDMDDSGSQVYTIASFTQDGPTGELWQATVSGSTVVVTKLFDIQRATALAFA